jgi:thiol-disulfide isomerase/thioredoxin
MAFTSTTAGIDIGKRKRHVPSFGVLLGFCFLLSSFLPRATGFATSSTHFVRRNAHAVSTVDSRPVSTFGIPYSSLSPAVAQMAGVVLDAESIMSRTSSGGGPSIRSRVKDFILTQRRKLKNRMQPAVVEIEDIDVFRYLLNHERNSYTAVMFHAPFCKACKASLPLYQRLARQYKRHKTTRTKEASIQQRDLQLRYPQGIKFLSVAVTKDNSQFLEDVFGVTKFPLAQIYHPQDGLVDERPVLRKLFPGFETKLQSFVKGIP